MHVRQWVPPAALRTDEPSFRARRVISTSTIRNKRGSRLTNAELRSLPQISETLNIDTRRYYLDVLRIEKNRSYRHVAMTISLHKSRRERLQSLHRLLDR